jgi:pyrroline-5-carboxylate reductase
VTSIGILGVGGLAALMVRGVQRAGYHLVLSPRNAEVSARLSADYDCEVAGSNQAVVDASDGVFVSLPAANGTEELARLTFRPGQPVLSAMAGTGLTRLQSVIGPARAAISMMPGYANALGGGPSILYPDDAFWRPFLAATGPVQAFDEEASFTTAATFGAFSGASFAFMAHAIGWYEEQGLTPATARALVAATLRGNADVLLSEDRSLPEIQREVITPGGISELLVTTLTERKALAAWDEALTRVLRRIGG